MRSIFLLILLPSTALADGYCFVRPTPKPVVVVKPTQIINRMVRLEPAKQPTVDVEGIIAEARALEMAWQAIPERELQQPRWRAFRFRNNIGSYTAPASQKQTTQFRTVTRRVAGVVNTSFRILPDGTLDFGVSQQSGY